MYNKAYIILLMEGYPKIDMIKLILILYSSCSYTQACS